MYPNDLVGVSDFTIFGGFIQSRAAGKGASTRRRLAGGCSEDALTSSIVGRSRRFGTEFFVRAPLRCFPAAKPGLLGAAAREPAAQGNVFCDALTARLRSPCSLTLASGKKKKSCTDTCLVSWEVRTVVNQYQPPSAKKAFPPGRQILKRLFQNRLVSECGVVKMYYFASF